MQLLRQENTTLWVKLDSVQQIVNKKPIRQKAASAPLRQQEVLSLISLFRWVRKVREKQQVTMSSKYRLEDRYVSYIVKEPKLDSNLHLRFQSEAPEAVIELDVTEDSFGLGWPHATMM